MPLIKKRKKEKKNPKAWKKILVTGLLTLCGLFLFSAIIIFFRLQAYKKEASALVNSMGRDAFSSNLTSIIYDKKGTPITSMSAQKDCYYLTSDNIPYMVKLAFVTTEDRKFYEHKGIDYKAIVRASLSFLKNREITQGGSTITQQLSRNIFLSHEVTFDRKIKEIFIAGMLEDTYSKEELLEFYINNIYFGNGFYGIQSAAKGYFDKSITQLSLSQMIFLCAIPNNPTLYDPFTNMEAALARRDRILLQMYEQQNIDRDMYEQACGEAIQLTPHKKEKSDYVETFVRHCAVLSLMEDSGFEIEYYFDSDIKEEIYHIEYNQLYSQFSNQLFTKGYRIYTTIDMDMQDKLQKTVNNTLKEYSKKKNQEGIYTFQGAAVCIDNATGYVNAIVGGRSQKFNGYTLNRAYQSHRQPGSSIKPILTYTPLLGKGYTASSIVNDEKIKGGPKNSPNVYEGEMTFRDAIIKSKNTVAWSLFEQLSPATGLQYLKDMNFSKIDTRDYVMAASIGGFTYGTSPLEMASAYCTIANNGVYRTPTCISKITDSTKAVIVEHPMEEKRIYEENACVVITDILKDVLEDGTGKHYQVTNAQCAAKTGTTNGNRDSWLVGYSKYYTTAVWTGYDMPKIISDGVGNTLSGKIWQQFMTSIHENKKYIEFPEYPEKTLEDASIQDWKNSKENSDSSSEDNTKGQENTTSDSFASSENENAFSVGSLQKDTKEHTTKNTKLPESNTKHRETSTSKKQEEPPSSTRSYEDNGEGLYTENWEG